MAPRADRALLPDRPVASRHGLDDHMTDSVPLRVKQLTKHYRVQSGGWLEAVSDVSLEVRAGECFGLLGPNGAGKTTAIHCISGFYPATSGQVLIGGVDVCADPKRARQMLGICAQDDTLDSDFRVFDQRALCHVLSRSRRGRQAQSSRLVDAFRHR